LSGAKRNGHRLKRARYELLESDTPLGRGVDNDDEEEEGRQARSNGMGDGEMGELWGTQRTGDKGGCVACIDTSRSPTAQGGPSMYH
jgi:hypothetical protein